MDHVIEIEISLQYLNNLFAKSVAFTAHKIQQQLDVMRHQIYYGVFDYATVMHGLEKIDKELEAHVRV
jgi:hypothetical protein